MPKHSAGILLYRRRRGRIEVFLVHPGGPFWKNKDAAAWSIPKGEFEPPEAALDAAKREVAEETGLALDGDFLALTPVKQSGGKIVSAWALEGDADPASIVSNNFSLEWPPRSGKTASFPEIDRAAWFDLETARAKIHKGQVGFLDELAERLRS
ncbi:MAG: NUDIX domain-containing protein [Candidatus Eiseniibacteriota bacterium]